MLDEKSGYLHNGALVANYHVRSTVFNDDPGIQMCDRTLLSMSANFEALLEDSTHTDIAIRVETDTVETDTMYRCTRYVHSLILIAWSPVFKAMLKHDMKEKHCREIIISGSDPASVDVMLKFLYRRSPRHTPIDHHP